MRLGLFGYPAPYFALKFYQTSTAQSEHWMLRVPLRSTLPKIRLLDLLHARGVSPTSYRSVGSTRSQTGLHFVPSVRKSASCSFAFNGTHLPFPLTKTIHWIVFVRQSALSSLAPLGFASCSRGIAYELSLCRLNPLAIRTIVRPQIRYEQPE